MVVVKEKRMGGGDADTSNGLTASVRMDELRVDVVTEIEALASEYVLGWKIHVLTIAYISRMKQVFFKNKSTNKAIRALYAVVCSPDGGYDS